MHPMENEAPIAGTTITPPNEETNGIVTDKPGETSKEDGTNKPSAEEHRVHDGKTEEREVAGQGQDSTIVTDPLAPHALLDRLSNIDRRLDSMHNNYMLNLTRQQRRRRSSSSGSSSSGNSHVSDIEVDDGHVPRSSDCIPQVRECNWEQFKNRFGPHDKQYALEVLIAGENLKNEIVREQRKRLQAEERIFEDKLQNGEKLFRRKFQFNEDAIETTDSKRSLENRWIDRVRINSVTVLARLGKIAGEKWGTEDPRTFFRPYRAFIHYQDKMKQELTDLGKKLEVEAKLGPDSNSKEPKSLETKENGGLVQSASPLEKIEVKSNQAGHPEPTMAPSSDNIDSSSDKVGIRRKDSVFGPWPEDDEQIRKKELQRKMDCKEAWNDLDCYVKFVEEKLVPLYHRFDTVDEEKPQKIRFSELWYLFRVGEDIYIPSTTEQIQQYSSGLPGPPPSRVPVDSTKQRRPMRPPPSDPIKTEVDQKICKLHSLVLPSVEYEVTALKDGKVVLRDDDSPVTCHINCYCLDYDGSSYGPVRKDFRITSFEGEKYIRELEVYPLRFAQDKKAIREEYEDMGNKFVQYLKERPLAYNGWTLTTDILGRPLRKSDGEILKHPEHIDSDVIVDFKEAFQTFPPWRPDFSYSDVINPSMTTDTDKFAVIHWSDDKRTKIHSKRTEMVVEDDDVDWIERNQNIMSDPCLQKGSNQRVPSEKNLVILPRRMFAYALRERKFVHVDLRYLKPVAEHNDAFKSLQIDESHRRTIQAIVTSHLRDKDVEKTGREIRTQDLIRGKGRGFIILLHGVPGVGKTATAEAVAQFHKRPLFPISSGDLGYTAESVETTLVEIFRLAHLWDCILLLDEADVFLSQRTKDNLQRNALISVFLRILEYFNGILFLTSNRPGTLDEAVKSRVHASLYYGPLGETETVEIFKLNLIRLHEIEQQRAEATDREKLFIFDDEIIAFARKHYRMHQNGTGRWNGRQIRNAFQIAASLAHYDGDSIPGAQKQLGERHFQTVDDATTKYDEYRARIAGKLEDELAREREERDDGFGTAERVAEERRHAGRGYGGGYEPSRSSWNPPSTPSPMPYGNVPPHPHGQGGSSSAYGMATVPQMPPHTPPARAAAPSSSNPYAAPHHGHGGYPPASYSGPGAPQIPPLQDHRGAPHQGNQPPPDSYGQNIPTHPNQNYGRAPPEGYGGWTGGGSGTAAGIPPSQNQGPVDGGRGYYDPTSDAFASGQGLN